MSNYCHIQLRQLGILTPGNVLCVLKTDNRAEVNTICSNHPRTSAIKFICGLLLWATGQAAVSAPIEPIDHSRTVASNYLHQWLQHSNQKDYNVHVDRHDSRLRLAKRNDPLQIFLPTAKRLIGKMALGVDCPTDKQWKVNITTQVDAYGDVVDAARPILRDQGIGANDIQLIQQKASKRSQAYFHNPDQFIDMITKFSIPVAKVISLQKTRAARLVQRGERDCDPGRRNFNIWLCA